MGDINWIKTPASNNWHVVHPRLRAYNVNLLNPSTLSLCGYELTFHKRNKVVTTAANAYPEEAKKPWYYDNTKFYWMVCDNCVHLLKAEQRFAAV